MMIQRGSPPGTSPAPCLHRATVSPSPLINIHHLVFVTLLAGASMGCDPHVDPVCLGRAEAQMMADVNATDDTHHTPLLMTSCMEVAELLIDAGADVDLKLKEGSMGQDDEHDHDKAGDAAFDKIVRSYSEKNSSRVCTLLMTKGARLDELNAKDLTPLHEALADGRNKTSELFREYAAETSAELKAAEK